MGIFSNLIVKLGLDSKEFKKGVKDSKKTTNEFANSIKDVGGNIAAAFSVGAIISFTKELLKIKGEAEGVNTAFDRLENSVKLMGELKAATKGTVNELELKKAAVQWKNFNLDLSQMPKFLEFANRTAKATGQSVDYLTNSIVLGLGRKSPLILDNLGISTVELNNEVKKTGDFVKAAANIADKRLKEMGDDMETTGEKTAQLAASWDNLKLAMSDNLFVGNLFGAISKGLDSVAKRLKSTFTLWQQFKASMQGVDLVKMEAEGAKETDKIYQATLARVKAAKTEEEAVKAKNDAIKKLREDEFKREDDFQKKRLELLEKHQKAQQKLVTFIADREDKKAAKQAFKELNDFLKGSGRQQRQLADVQSLQTSKRLETIDPLKVFKESQKAANKGTKEQIGLIAELEAKIKKLQEEQKKSYDPQRIKETVKEIENLNSEIDRLLYSTGKVPDTGELAASVLPINISLEGGVSDKNEIELEKMKQAIKDRLKGMKDDIEKDNTLQIDLSGLVAGVAESIGTAIGSGDFSQLGDNLLQAMGGFISQLGQMILMYGGLMVAFEDAFANPFVAIAVGTAAIVLGAAISASASSAKKNVASSKSMGGSSGGYGSSDKTSNTALFNRAGQRVSGYDTSRGETPVLEMRLKGKDAVAMLRRNDLKGKI